ncbi:hypothetical protein pb186bvf_017883 [Paramecium bursaria]
MIRLFYLLPIVYCHLFGEKHLASKHFKLIRHEVQNSNKSYSEQDIILQNRANLVYLIQVSFGTPQQNFLVQADTGSSILWVQGVGCQGCINQDGFFDSNKSSTYLALSQNYTQKYGTGICTGAFSMETVGVPETDLSVTSFKFLDVIEAKYFTAPFQGIMGLSNWLEYENIFDIAYKEGLIKSPLFGFKIKAHPKQSYLFYDEWDDDILSNTVWVPASKFYKWSLLMIGFQIEGVDVLNLLQGDGKHALIDTGASSIFIDQTIIDYLWDNHFSAICPQELRCPCSSPLYPTLTFYFQGAKIILKPEKYLYSMDFQGPYYQGYCHPNFQYNPAGTITTLGDPVMQSFISIYDKPNQLIGLYKAIDMDEFSISYFIILLTLSGLILFYVFILFYLLYKL